MTLWPSHVQLQEPMSQKPMPPDKHGGADPSKSIVYTLFEVYNWSGPATAPSHMLSFLIALGCLATGSSAYVIGQGAQAAPGSSCNTCQVQYNPPPCNTCGSQPAMGNWGEWGPWSSCSSAYGSPSQTRQRTCSAAQCPGGSSSEARPCALYDPAPQWGEWTSYGTCSASCGGGICTRTRVCNNGCSSCQCVGSSVEQKACNTQQCCEWTSWSGWSPCSVTCGTGGYRSRTRQCSCTTGCTGNSSEQQSCNAQNPCPVPVCQTCQQPQYEPPPCSTCNQPPPPCNTCGANSGSYNPYDKKKREILAITSNSTRV